MFAPTDNLNPRPRRGRSRSRFSSYIRSYSPSRPRNRSCIRTDQNRHDPNPRDSRDVATAGRTDDEDAIQRLCDEQLKWEYWEWLRDRELEERAAVDAQGWVERVLRMLRAVMGFFV
jgi:hypothetical protein